MRCCFWPCEFDVVESGVVAVIISEGESLAIGVSGSPFAALPSETASCSLLILLLAAFDSECASLPAAGVCDDADSACELVGGGLSLAMFEGGVMLLR